MNQALVVTFVLEFLLRATCLSLDPKGNVTVTIHHQQAFTCSVEKSWLTIAFNLDNENIVFLRKNQTNCENHADNLTDLYTLNCDYDNDNFSFTIKNVTKDFDGKFIECNIGTENVKTYIIVPHPPELPPSIKQSPNGAVTENANVELTCEVIGGNPLAAIVWECSGFTYVPTTDQSNGKVELGVERFVTKDDNGKECICIGRHALWNTSKNASHELKVYYRPIVTVSPEYNIYDVLENTTNIQLTCKVAEANPINASYWWLRNSSFISNSARFNILRVKRSDTGIYACEANNSVGISDLSTAIHLKVMYVELNKLDEMKRNEGARLSFSCNGQSYPEFTENHVTWTKKNNDSFFRTGRQIVIPNVNRNDSGTYVCSVILKATPTNGLSVNITGTTTVNVNIFYKPTVSVFPDFNQSYVTENSTGLRMICNVTDANPELYKSYSWSKDGSELQSAATYTIPTVKRSHTGSYTCDASNPVGTSDPSPVFQLNVLYGVSLKLSVTEISVNESERWNILFISDGNPLPTITCVYIFNSSVVGEAKTNVTTIGIKHANCIDTGLYMCTGNNTIGAPVSKSAHIRVACKPRTYNNVDKEDIFINGADESLTISTTFISFPLSNISWFRQLPDGNLTDLDSKSINSTIQSQLPYETISILQKDLLKKDDFGIYLVKASNIHGSFCLKYHVIPKRAPDPPTNITASCDVSSILVTWIAGFNGGENQTFRINFANTISNQTLFINEITDRRDNININVIKESVSPDTLYRIRLEASNVYGTTKSTEITNCTTQKNQEENQRLTSAFVGGIAGSISALLIVVIVIGGLYCRRRRKFTGEKIELNERESNETDEDEDGLKDNPLYVTSGEVSNAEEGPVYGVVNKPTQNKDKISPDDKKEQGPVYAEVQKSSTHDGLKDNPLYVPSGDVSNAEEGPVYGVVNKSKKKKENVDSDDKKNRGPVHAEVQKSSKHEKKKQKKKKTKDTSKKGTIYENSNKTFKHTDSEELYANAGEQDDGIKLPVLYTPKKNKDGLIYADVDLLPGPSGNRFVIRGQENRTNYAIIDLSKKAEPLPSDNEDEDNDSINLN